MTHFRKWSLASLVLCCLSQGACRKHKTPNAVETAVGNAASGAADFPKTLVETRFFKSMVSLEAGEGVFSYQINAEFWSDAALKSRFIYVPPGEVIHYESNHLVFPNGTAFIKHFASADNTAVETRIIKLDSQGQWQFATYIWQEDGTTSLNTDGGIIQAHDKEHTEFRIPSQKQCASCHAESQGVEAGFRLEQLLPIQQQKITQIAMLRDAGVLELDDEATKGIQPFINPGDASVSLEQRARTYLQVNCSLCHNPEGIAAAYGYDMRIGTARDQTKLISQAAIIPGNPEASLLWQKMSATSADHRMPPPSLRPDAMAVQLMSEWIKSLSPDNGQN